MTGQDLTLGELSQQMSELRDLFVRRLVEDKSKNQIIQTVQESLATRDRMDSGELFGELFREALLAIDRLNAEVPGAELNASIAEELLTIFERRGLEIIVPTGAVDPRIHEVIGTIPAGDSRKPGTIAHVERDGYILGGRLLRAARVVVVADSGTSPS